MIPLSAAEIAAVVGGTVEGDGGVMVTAPAALDGRQAEPGGLFVAFAGEQADGHDYAGQAGRAGAVAVLGSRPTPLPTVVVEDAQAALQALAAHVAARLRDGLAVAGLTGSRGKTSAKDLLAAVLSSAAPTVATIGSLNNELGVPLTMLRAGAATRFLVLEMGARRVGSGAWSCAAPPAARCCSTIPLTPTPTRRALHWTRWRRSRAGAASPSSARCLSSATTARPSTALSGNTPPPGPT
jgi:UDP-N-acetylmuramyl pentapeptide synthase